jgi:hypothetical protein
VMREGERCVHRLCAETERISLAPEPHSGRHPRREHIHVARSTVFCQWPTTQGVKMKQARGNVAGEPVDRFSTMDSFLTGCIVQYGEANRYGDGEPSSPDEVGLGLVLRGEDPFLSRVLDLGSAREVTLNLSHSVVMWEWTSEETLAAALDLASEEARSGGSFSGWSREPIRGFCENLTIDLLRRVGFNPLRRPVFLRVGFRDLVQDLDPHEHPAIRLKLPHGDSASISFDADNNVLLIARSAKERNPQFEWIVSEAFPAAWVELQDATLFRLRFQIPLDLDEAITESERIRQGVLSLLDRYDPEWFESISILHQAIGRRRTLDSMRQSPPLQSPRDAGRRWKTQYAQVVMHRHPA